jgi:hypothetical protein
MTRNRLAITAPVIGCFLIAGCKTEIKDSQLRWYVQGELKPFLDSVAYQLCALKASAAPSAPGRNICTGPPDGYHPPPSDGKP